MFIISTEKGILHTVSEWVQPFKGDKLTALCSACDRIIDISNTSVLVRKLTPGKMVQDLEKSWNSNFSV